MKKIRVAIIVGSDSDLPVAAATVKVLDELGLPNRVNIASAHRTPERVRQLVRDAENHGAGVFIALAGMSAALPGVIAAETMLPVIGVPLEGKSLGGLDALFSVGQMPPGVPVAAVAVGKPGATNAAILAAEILATGDLELRGKIIEYRKRLTSTVVEKDNQLQKLGLEKYLEEKNR